MVRDWKPSLVTLVAGIAGALALAVLVMLFGIATVLERGIRRLDRTHWFFSV